MCLCLHRYHPPASPAYQHLLQVELVEVVDLLLKTYQPAARNQFVHLAFTPAVLPACLQVELMEIVDFFQKPERFRESGSRIPRGVLLCGPPGTGKTLLGGRLVLASRAGCAAGAACQWAQHTCPTAVCDQAHFAHAHHCLPACLQRVRWRGRRAPLSSPSMPRSLWRCLWGWAPPACATSSHR